MLFIFTAASRAAHFAQSSYPTPPRPRPWSRYLKQDGPGGVQGEGGVGGGDERGAESGRQADTHTEGAWRCGACVLGVFRP